MRIATLDKHRKCLRYCFEEAEKRLLIFLRLFLKLQ